MTITGVFIETASEFTDALTAVKDNLDNLDDDELNEIKDVLEVLKPKVDALLEEVCEKLGG